MEQAPQEFAEIMLGLAEEWEGKLSEVGINMKWRSLKKFSMEEIRLGASYLLENRETTWPRVPATQELIKAIEIIQNPINAVDVESIAEFQANEVLAFLRQHGFSAVPVFDDPITRGLMTMVWPYYSWGKTLTDKDKPFWRKDFTHSYIKYAQTGRTMSRLNISDKFLKLTRTVSKHLTAENHPIIQLPLKTMANCDR